jgi:hypothetical protein
MRKLHRKKPVSPIVSFRPTEEVKKVVSMVIVVSRNVGEGEEQVRKPGGMIWRTI